MEKSIKFLEQIRNTNSSNEKLELLKKGLSEDNDKTLELLLHKAYNDEVFGINNKTFQKAYNIDSLKECEDIGEWIEFNIEQDENNDSLPIDDLITCINRIKNTTGNELIRDLSNFSFFFSNKQQVWLARTLLKNLRIGMNVTQINKALDYNNLPLIDTFICQLAKKVDKKEWEKIPYPNFTEIKYDGVRVVAKIEPYKDKIKNSSLFVSNDKDKKITLLSRQNKDCTKQFPEIVKYLEEWAELNGIWNSVLDGEIIDTKGFNDLQKRLGRKPENIEKSENLIYNIFDIWNFENSDMKNLFFESRRNFIKNFEYIDNVLLSKGKLINNKEELLSYYETVLEKGYEGVVIKSFDNLYALEKKDERKGQWKLKPESDVELRVVGYDYGTGRLHDVISILHLKSDDNLIKCSTGSGLTDEWRKYLTKHKDELIGQIVELSYGEMTNKDDHGNYSLRWPIFKTIRFDKKITD